MLRLCYVLVYLHCRSYTFIRMNEDMNKKIAKESLDLFVVVGDEYYALIQNIIIISYFTIFYHVLVFLFCSR